MSSFKRRIPAKNTAISSSHKPNISETENISTSYDQTQGSSLLSGLSSIDDILGLGGLPSGHVLLIRTPDPHSAWGSMISRYSIAQGLVSGDTVIIVSQEEDARELVSGCMWTSDAIAISPTDADEGDPEVQPQEEIKIAWRYEKMKQFSTTVPKRVGAVDQESASFDLTLRIPAEMIAHSQNVGQLVVVPLSQERESQSSTCDAVLGQIHKLTNELNRTNSSRRAIRIIIPDLGDSSWGDLHPSQLIRFLLALRGLLRGTSAAAFITLSSGVSSDNWGGPGWIGKLSYVSDGCITLAGFGDDPTASLSFPNHHGMVKVASSPSPGTLRAPSITRSSLRGMSSSGPHGGGENNLAFRCTRRRLVIETMHLGAEGGIGARQTTAPSNLDGPADSTVTHAQPTDSNKPARVAIAFDTQEPGVQSSEPSTKETRSTKAKQKRVLFQHDKPEIYDF